MKRTFVCLMLLLGIKLGFTQNSFTELVTKTEKSVVTVKTYDTEGEPLKVGTAFFIDESGILLSNFHVLRDSYSAKVITLDGKEYDVKKIISSNKELDIIKFNISNPLNEHFPILVISSLSILKGEDVFVIGSPGGFESSVSKGIVSAIRDVPEVGKLYQITAPISSGSSGSPVFNMQGKVVGIATLQYQDGQNMNFAIDINLVKKLCENSEIIPDVAEANLLPDDKVEAMKIINENFFFTLSSKIKVINEYIKKYPNDYFGYLKRAVAYVNPLYRPEELSMDISKKKMLEYLNLSDKDFAKALQLSSNKSIVYYYRGISKYKQSKYDNLKLKGWDINSALADLNNCNASESGFNDAYESQISKFEYIGDIKSDLKDYIGALVAYKQAITNYPKRDKIYELYGYCADIYYYDLHDLEKAKTNIDKAFTIIDKFDEE